MKYSIIIPYACNRETLLYTLNSYVSHYSHRNDYEVVIVEEKKNIDNEVHHARLLQIIGLFKNRINIHYVRYTKKDLFNSSILFNLGAKSALGDILVLTNPECYHEVNILKGFDEEFAKDMNSYVVCSCLAVSLENDKVNILKWYQHSKYINRMSHFCSAIAKERYFSIGGFDEEYAKGIAYDDDDFRDTILCSNFRVVLRDDLVVSHLEHSREYQVIDLVKKNEMYYRRKWNRQEVMA